MPSPKEPPSEPEGMWVISDEMLAFIEQHWPHIEVEGRPER